MTRYQNLPQAELLQFMQNFLKNTACETLGMELTEVNQERLVMRMPVTPKQHQPMGLLHGGISAALVESVASCGSAFHCVEGTMPVGVEINCNHLRSKREGWVEAVGTPIHLGQRIHVWEVRLNDEQGRLIATGRCTIAIVPIPAEK